AFSEEMGELVTKRTEQLEKMDERWASRFEPAGMAAILRSHGFCDIEDINFQEIRSTFGRAVQGLAPGQAGLHVVHAKHSSQGAKRGAHGRCGRGTAVLANIAALPQPDHAAAARQLDPACSAVGV